MNYNEFAESIKTKYPEYKDMDNRELAEKMIARYPQYNDITFDVEKKSFWQKTPEERNEDLKQAYSAKVKKRDNWEAQHPILSRLQADYQPGYRASRVDWEEKAKYGLDVPIGEAIKNDIKQAAVNQIPTANIAASLITKKPSGGVLNAMKYGAIEGATQGAVSEALDELANNGVNPQLINRTLAGAGGGAIGGQVGAVPALTKNVGLKLAGIKPETYNILVNPNSKALDLTEDTANILAQDTTERFRNAYQALLDKKGQAVQDAIQNLKGFEKRFDLGTLRNDIKSTFDKYQLDQSNRMRELTGNLENELVESINKKSLPFPDVDPNLPALKNIDPNMIDTVSPLSLEGEKLKLGKMINWDDPKAQAKNEILEQVYGKYNDRLSNLSPELAQANADYAQVADFTGQNSRLRSILNPKLDIETATSKFKNYKSTNNNIFDLEKQLVNEGNAPFLKDIDDANAAKELLESIKTGVNPLGTRDLLKEAITPGLKTIRNINSNAPWANQVSDAVRKLLIVPSVNKVTTPILYGQVSNY